MSVLNLDDRGVFECELSVGSARAFFDGQDLPDEVTGAIDEAQGLLSSDERVKESFIVIRVVR